MSTAVALQNQDPKALAIAQKAAQAAGFEESDSSDLMIPKLLLMQGLSQFVADDKAQVGDIVKSGTAEYVGGINKPVHFIPITYYRDWALYKEEKGKFEWQSKEPYTAANKDLPWEFEKDGEKWRRDKCFNLYVLLVKDIEGERKAVEEAQKTGDMPDPDKALLPCLITFRRSSYKTAKKIYAHFEKAKKFRSQAFVSTFALKSTKEKNEKATFGVFDVELVGKTPFEHQAVATQWWNDIVLAGRAIKVDDSDLKSEDSALEVESTVVNEKSEY